MIADSNPLRRLSFLGGDISDAAVSYVSRDLPISVIRLITFQADIISARPLGKLQQSFKAKGPFGAERRTPYVLRPTPYTLHPTPFTLHPAPYNLHPTPYTAHPTPYTLNLTP